MQLRPYQKTFINKCLSELKQRKETLGVAPTGAGKTIMLATTIDEYLKQTGNKQRVLVLVHRNKINFQNQKSFEKVCGRKTSFFISECKSLSGQVVFGMVQTIIQSYKELPAFDMIVIDEVHHLRASSYEDIIKDQRGKNPNLVLFGVTATPNRGDEKGLIKIINNVACQIKISELINLRYLVKPIAKVFNNFTLEDRSLISNPRFFEDSAILLLKELKDNNRKKIVIFVSNTEHLEFLEDYLNENEIKATSIISKYSDEILRENLRNFEEKDTRVLINIDIATEGYDYPPIDCVVLMRGIGNKGMLLQMVGRGLRIIDKTKYDAFKTDCLVLDFGRNFEVFGDLEQEIDLVGKDEDRPALLQLREQRDNEKKERNPTKITSSIFEGDLYDLGLFESFNHKDRYVRGICGFNKSIFCVDDNVFYINGEFVKKIENKKELDEVSEMIKRSHDEFFVKIKGEAITDFQCSLLIKEFDLVGCSRYRASVLINFLMNKEKVLCKNNK